MKRFGSDQGMACGTGKHHLFRLRLHLLIIMVKAALNGYPVGEYRKKAVLKNAAVVHNLLSDLDVSLLDLSAPSHLFKERVKLLCVMATAIISEDYPLGIHRKKAVLDNIDAVCEQAFPQQDMTVFQDVLKVA